MRNPAPIEPNRESKPLAPIEGGRLDEDHLWEPKRIEIAATLEDRLRHRTRGDASAHAIGRRH
jgi:hypothetical protein